MLTEFFFLFPFCKGAEPQGLVSAAYKSITQGAGLLACPTPQPQQGSVS